MDVSCCKRDKELIILEKIKNFWGSNYFMNWKCFFGFHEWTKWGGYINIGGGKFSQKFICKKCKKMKEVVR
jgi:hypothetical protein